MTLRVPFNARMYVYLVNAQVMLDKHSRHPTPGFDHIEDRPMSCSHAMKRRNPSPKATEINVDMEALLIRCAACVNIIEKLSREAAERKLAAAESHGAPPVDSKQSIPPAAAAATTSNLEDCALVLGLFDSVEAVTDLDSIYRKKLLHEVRILRLPAGSTLFQEGDPPNMVSVKHGAQLFTRARGVHMGVLSI